MKNLLLFCVCLQLFLSCKTETSSNKTGVFEHEQFTFEYAPDWSITDEDPMEEGLFFVSIEKNGFDSSGLLALTTITDELDLDEAIALNLEQLATNPVVNDLDYESIMDASYNNNEARKINFTFSTLGIKHQGSILAFNKNDKGFILLKQEALEDIKHNDAGFKIIESSFTVK
ncbi:hypothetical protein [Psychroserpens sp.]|uniref:hypothetical protein n=1 Tax=Psychroserpens sp. TaxID=2020870 RepID=UPI003C7346FC